MLSFFRDAKSKLQEQPFNFVFKYIFSPWFFPSSNYLLSDTAFNAWKLLSYQIWIKRIHHRNEMHFTRFLALQLIVCLNQIWNISGMKLELIIGLSTCRLFCRSFNVSPLTFNISSLVRTQLSIATNLNPFITSVFSRRQQHEHENVAFEHAAFPIRTWIPCKFKFWYLL